MKVAVVNYTSGNLSGGYQKYVERLMPLLRARPEISELRVYAPWGYNRSSADNPIEKWPQGSGRATRTWIRTAVREFSPDVVFIPTARIVRVDDIPTVVMVRNMEPLVAEAEEGNPLSDRIRNAARRFAARHACKSATRVIGVSNFVRDVIEGRWGIPAERIGIVSHGVEQMRGDSRGAAPAVEKWAGGKPFLFAAGSIRPARGLDDVVNAWPALRKKLPGLRLVIAGKADRGGVTHLEDLKRRIAAMGAGDEIFWAGQLGEGAMSWCYSHSAAFVMTSRVEACPNVVLEAMANGALSLSTDAPPMPEFFGNAAQYYEARSAESLASGVIALLSREEAQKAAMRAESRTRAADFTWERTAELTVAELTRAFTQASR